MSKLTDEQMHKAFLNIAEEPAHTSFEEFMEEGDAEYIRKYGRAIEAAATEPLLQRIAELEQWQAAHWNALQIIDNYLVSKNLLQVVEDGGPEAAARNVVHSIADLERRIEVGKNIVRNDMHRIGQLQAQVTELERQLEEARKDVKPCPTCESLARAVMLDQTGKS